MLRMDAPTTVARLACDEPTARRLAAYLGEIFGADDTACAAFEGDDGQWQVAIHFRDKPDEANLRAQVALAAGDKAAATLSIEPVQPADWVAQSLAGLQPVRAGRFIVHGAHDRARIKPNDIAIEIEAALAFGTGHHGTTRGCLLALDGLCKSPPRGGRSRRVLDLGTGSGVLAIAAARALRRRVLATDIDASAVRVARANARLNRTGPTVEALKADGVTARSIRQRAPFDLVFANILLGPLQRIAAPLKRLVAPGGRVVVSGLLPAHANAAMAAYRPLVLERRIDLDGWTTLVLAQRTRRQATSI